MLRELYDKKRDTFDETAEKNRENIIGLSGDVDNNTKVIGEIKAKAADIDNNTESIRQINLKLKGVQDVEFLQIELTPDNFGVTNSYDCINEIFTKTAIILVGITADNGVITDNMKTIADAGIQAEEIEVDGTLKFTCKKKPAKNVYFSIMIFNAI